MTLPQTISLALALAGTLVGLWLGLGGNRKADR